MTTSIDIAKRRAATVLGRMKKRLDEDLQADTTVPALWKQQNADFMASVVEGVLLPHYMADPGVPQASKKNIAVAVAEHKAFLGQIKSSQSPGEKAPSPESKEAAEVELSRPLTLALIAEAIRCSDAKSRSVKSAIEGMGSSLKQVGRCRFQVDLKPLPQSVRAEIERM